MIDIHFHCLPGIDDGPASWDLAVALCRMAAGEGVEAIVATPHVLRDPWINDDPSVRDALVVRLNDLLGGSPAILPGCELYFSAELPDLLEAEDSPVTTLDRGDHLLVEFPALGVPKSADAVFHELELLGVVPVIAHPERNLELASDPGRVRDLVGRGARTQITAGSLLGDFGRSAFEAAVVFHEEGLIDVIASDSHNLDRRPPRIRAAREWVQANWGEDAERRYFEENPAAMVGSDRQPERAEARP